MAKFKIGTGLLLLFVGWMTVSAALVYGTDQKTTPKAQKAIHTKALNDWQVFVSCQNGRTPAVAQVAGSLVVSCEGRVEE